MAQCLDWSAADVAWVGLVFVILFGVIVYRAWYLLRRR